MPITRGQARALGAAQGAVPEAPGGHKKRMKKRVKQGEEQPSTPAKRAAAPRSKAGGSAAPPAAAAGAAPDVVHVNRAPVLTLWASVVAEVQGYTHEEALSFGKYIAGLLAQSKGRSLGIYEEKERTEEERRARLRAETAAGVQRVDVFGMRLPCVATRGKRLAWSGSAGGPVDPRPVQGYLERAFGGGAALSAATAALRALAEAPPRQELGGQAYRLYERIRPAWGGWGVPGAFSLPAVRRLAEELRTQRT